MTIENNFIESDLKEENDRCRTNLLNDPNYGIVLCFLDKFQSTLDLPNYPLQDFEDHLVNVQDQIPPRLIDFHFILLKRLSLAKNAQCEKFDSIITKFASRFDLNDSEHLTTTGYLQADINIKIRIIKNLLESQFDSNQTLKNALINKSSCEIKSSPLGRDRFGVSYWFIMDNDCFIRLFREDVDLDRTWTNIAKNRDELEKFIKLLVTDFAVRKRFPDWTIDYEQFSSLISSNEFEQCYPPTLINVKEEETETTPTDEVPIKRKRGRPKSSRKSSYKKKEETKVESLSNQDEKLAAIKRKRGRSRVSTRSSSNKINTKINEKTLTEENISDEYQSQQEETSIDDISLALRRSSRFRKASTLVVASESIAQVPDTQKKRLMNSKRKTSNARRRRKKTSRNDHLCLSTSSSDEQNNYPSEDEYNSDDYLPNQSQIDIDNNFFEFDDTNNEQYRPAKTAETSVIVTGCYVCSKSDQPDVLLLCDACNDAYHLECLRPILLSIPDGDWFCPLCEHKKLSNCLIEKLQELLINEMKSIKINECISASESEHENITNDEESSLSSSQINENSNLSSSSYFDDRNISQRGRYRRSRFDIKQIFSDTNDDPPIKNFNLQLPEKMTRLLRRHNRLSIKNSQQIKPLRTRLCNPSLDLNEQLGLPLVYVNSNENSRPIKSVITNSKQTLKIVRRWNDVQRRSRLKAINMKLLNETIKSDCTDENSFLYPDDTSPLHSHDDYTNCGIKDEDNTIILPKINLASIDQCSSRNMVKKADTNFDRLTRDIQCAVNEVYLVPMTTKAIDQPHVKRIQRTNFSPYVTKVSSSSHLSKLPNNAYNIFKSKDSSASSANDLSNILTPPSSSSALDTIDNQTTSIMNS